MTMKKNRYIVEVRKQEPTTIVAKDMAGAIKKARKHVKFKVTKVPYIIPL